MPRGRPRIDDAELIAVVVNLHRMGFSLRRIAQQLEREGWTNSNGNQYTAKQISRLIERHA